MKKILIAGGTGLVGTRLSKHLPADQYQIHILTRRTRPARGNIKYYEWDLEAQTIDAEAVRVDYIINLTGAGIADSRWSPRRKRVIIESRTQSAALIKKGIEESGHTPRAYLGASAIGYYGDRGSDWMREESQSGAEFLSDSCRAWEDAHMLIQEHVDRLIMLRIGIVLSMEGGALPKMLMTRSVGVFNYFGDGQQYYSWIHIDDLCRMMIHLLVETPSVGIYNGVAPSPATNKGMMQQILKDTRLSGLLIPAPAFALRLAMGEMSAVVLDSCRVSSDKVQATGFDYQFTNVGPAVADLLTEGDA